MEAARELELVGAWKKGDKEAFRELYDAYVKKVYSFVYYKVLHREQAEDVTSETFLKALSKINSFDVEKGSLLTWLYTIARNTVIDHARVKKETVDLEVAFDLGKEDGLDESVDAKEHVAKVQKYLSTLHEEQREIIIMRVWNDLSYKEIAEILGKSEASCKMMFSRAIGKLRSEIPLIMFIILFIRL